MMEILVFEQGADLLVLVGSKKDIAGFRRGIEEGNRRTPLLLDCTPLIIGKIQDHGPSREKSTAIPFYPRSNEANNDRSTTGTRARRGSAHRYAFGPFQHRRELLEHPAA